MTVQNDALRILAPQILNTQRVRMALNNQLRAFQEDNLGAPSFAQISMCADSLRQQEKLLYAQLDSAVDPEHSVVLWVRRIPGLGPSIYLYVGLLPRGPEQFEKVGQLYSYSGLRPGAKRVKGERLRYNPWLRVVLISRVFDALNKRMDSPYKPIYWARKEHTLVTHPPMTEECGLCCRALQLTKEKRANSNQTRERKAPAYDCAHFGGPHWSDPHRTSDAKRITAKAVVLDLWRVDRGMSPRYDVNGETKGLADNQIPSVLPPTTPVDGTIETPDNQSLNVPSPLTGITT